MYNISCETAETNSFLSSVTATRVIKSITSLGTDPTPAPWSRICNVIHYHCQQQNKFFCLSHANDWQISPSSIIMIPHRDSGEQTNTTTATATAAAAATTTTTNCPIFCKWLRLCQVPKRSPKQEPDARAFTGHYVLPVTQPAESKYWRKTILQFTCQWNAVYFSSSALTLLVDRKDIMTVTCKNSCIRFLFWKPLGT